MNTKQQRGFTLIELLVVIAIIGILSAVVLASLNTARSKGNDAAVQSDLDSIRTEAEIQYGNLGNSYGTAVANNADCASLLAPGTLFADTVIQKALKGAQTAAGGAKSSCNVTSTGYVIAAPMSGTAVWCIESNGVGRNKTSGGVAYNALIGAAPAAFVSGATVCN